jgi:hypothetical protein|tara:strand:- start:1060 stop:2250 length:1191 start_codon:yes stop_codon:yes gene_type:complete
MSFENFFGEAEFNYELEKKKFIDNMDFLKDMSVEESTLWKKWEEFNKDPQFFMDRADTIDRLEKTIWQPTDIFNKEQTIQEINSISPIVEPVEQGNAKANEDWILTRRLIHSMEFTPNPGRNLKFYVKDKSTNKVLGLICLGSDVTSLGVRDDMIGWTKENKFKEGKLNHTAIGTTICCVQPLGFNMLGGKLVAQMVTSKVVRDTWKKVYGQTLVGISTTALYGIHSMYNGIPQWKTLGETKGKISLKPDDKFYDVWHHWLKENKFEEYDKKVGQPKGALPVTGIKQKIIQMIYQELGIKRAKYEHGFKRGAYFANVYQNGKEFLRSEINEDELIIRNMFDRDIEYIDSWWKRKAVNRYTKLLEQNKIRPEKLFYSGMINISWEEAKEKYLGDIGR